MAMVSMTDDQAAWLANLLHDVWRVAEGEHADHTDAILRSLGHTPGKRCDADRGAF